MFEGLFRGEHLLLVLLVVVLLFPGKVGSVGGALGKTLRDFKKAMSGEPEQRPSGAEPPRSLAEKKAD